MTATWVKGWVESTEGGSSMSHWKQQTREGNRLFDCGEYHQALACYQQALWLANQQLALWHDADEAVAALVVSHHNQADLLVAMARPERAAELLCYVHDCLLATCHFPSCPSRLREAALRHIHTTRAELLTFVQRHGRHAGIMHSLSQCLCQKGPSSRVH